MHQEVGNRDLVALAKIIPSTQRDKSCAQLNEHFTAFCLIAKHLHEPGKDDRDPKELCVEARRLATLIKAEVVAFNQRIPARVRRTATKLFVPIELETILAIPMAKSDAVARVRASLLDAYRRVLREASTQTVRRDIVPRLHPAIRPGMSATETPPPAS